MELTETLRAEKNDLMEKLGKMRNVKGESLASRVAQCLKILGDLVNHTYDREKLRNSLQYFIGKIRLGFKNKKIMEIEFPTHLEMIGVPKRI